jgi:GT2 family glycosyltransferase
MAPTATVILPTQHRPDYLEVALASIVPQARAAGAGVLVVDDGPSDDTRAVAERHGVDYLANHGGHGLNAARNLALDATDSDLLVFVDDDVRVHAGWLDALLAAADALPDEAGVLTGPIVPVFEDHALRMCGREGAPITFLDHGSADTDAPYAWGANMTVRRTAITRAGRFDASRPLYGDEAEWQDRFKAAGGRVRYVAAAGLDHRRAGDDSRLRSLCRAAYGRGRASRRHDVFLGRAPTLKAELRVLAGCLVHSVRFTCANGIVMAAHTWGRVREAWAPVPPPATPGVDDFLSGGSGTVGGLRGRGRRVADVLADVVTARARRRARRLAARTGDRRPSSRVLVLGVERPGSLMPAALHELRRTRNHELTVGVGPLVPGRGKFANLDAQLVAHPPDGYDWLLVLDDDVRLPAGFLDVLIDQATRHDLKLAQPAHRLHSHAAWPVTRRHGAGTRRTTFVEIGPVTLFHRDTFDTLLPFPATLQMGWGLDAHWAAVARDQGWAIGVVDAVPIGHTIAPAGAGYSREAALTEARAFLATRPYVPRDEVRTLEPHP